MKISGSNIVLKTIFEKVNVRLFEAKKMEGINGREQGNSSKLTDITDKIAYSHSCCFNFVKFLKKQDFISSLCVSSKS